jgi:hypothetical protein
MARTKADLATEALRLLREIGADESPSAADGSEAENAYDDLRSELIDKGLAYWPSTTRTTAEIPAVVFRPVAMILAARLAPKYGKPEPVVADDDGKQVPMVAKGFRDLRRHLAKPASGLPTPATYF